jgi:uncharacterized protein (DUF924 family)
MQRTSQDTPAPSLASSVVDFWRKAGPSLWFAKDPDFDRLFRERFLELHEAAGRTELRSWQAGAEGSLALVLLLDQFPRNAFRGTPRMYATDARGRAVAAAAIAAGHHRATDPALKLFYVIPFGHSEDLADQERALELSRALALPIGRAEHHRDIVRRFGRFPHRNHILGRTTTPDEQRYLDEGGYTG